MCAQLATCSAELPDIFSAKKLTLTLKRKKKASDIWVMNQTGEQAGPFLLFQSSRLNLALRLEDVLEVVPMAALFSPPGTPTGIAGFLNLRGLAIAILRLDLLFKLPDQEPGLHTPLIIMRGTPGPVGILAESVRQVLSSAGNAWLPRDARGAFQDCASFAIDGRVTHLLEPNNVLQKHERDLVEQVRLLAQARLKHLEASH